MKKRILSIALTIVLTVTALLPFSSATVFADDDVVAEEVIAVNSVTVTDGTSEQSFEIEENDITSALKSAFKYISAQKDDGTIYNINIPEGTYNVSSSIEVSSNTTVNLKGVVLVDTYSNVFYSPTGYKAYNGLHNFTVNDGEFTYPSGNKTNTGCLIRFCHAKNIAFNRTKFSNNYNSHHVEIAGCSNVTFDSCVFNGQTANINDGSAEALQIDVLCETHFPDMGAYDETMNNNITVKNCSFTNLVRGVGTHIGMRGKYQSNIKILNNTFDNCRATAISCFNYINTTVSGNKITKCGQGVMFYMMQNDSNIKLTEKTKSGSINTNCNSVISNNNISVIKTSDVSDPSPIYIFGNNVTSAKAKPQAPAGNYLVGNIKVQNNTVTTVEFGIRLFDTINSVVSGNTVTTSNSSNSRQGIILDNACKNVNVSSNKISKFKQGISVENSSNNTVQSNNITSPSEHGVMVKNSSATTVKGNTVNTPGKTGCMSSGSKTTKIISNKIVSPKSHGFGFINKSSDTEVSSNIVTNSAANGVYIDSGCTFQQLKIISLQAQKITALVFTVKPAQLVQTNLLQIKDLEFSLLQKEMPQKF